MTRMAPAGSPPQGGGSLIYTRHVKASQIIRMLRQTAILNYVNPF